MATACGGVLNPWNHLSTPRNRRIAVAVIATSAIAAVVGALALLPILSGGVGGFHTFTTFPKVGAFTLTIGGVAFAILGFTWLATSKASRAVIAGADVAPDPALAFTYPDRQRSLRVEHTLTGLEDYPPRANPATLIREPYPANKVLENVYLIARKPVERELSMEHLVGPQRVSVVIKLVPNSPEPRADAGASRPEGMFKIEEKSLPRPHQVVTFHRPCMHNIAAAMGAIAELRNAIGDVRIDASNPMLVLATDEKESGAFVLLYELARRVEETGDANGFVGRNFWDEVMHFAKAIEHDSFSGAAIEWANTILTQLFEHRRLYNPELSDSNPGNDLDTDELGIKYMLQQQLQEIFDRYLTQRNP